MLSSYCGPSQNPAPSLSARAWAGARTTRPSRAPIGRAGAASGCDWLAGGAAGKGGLTVTECGANPWAGAGSALPCPHWEHNRKIGLLRLAGRPVTTTS